MRKINKIEVLINKVNNFLRSKILLIFLGIIILGYYIWFRFIRERLPRDIPFDLSFISLFVLIIICVSYIYKIYKIIKPSKSNILTSISPLLNVIVKPLLLVNELILSRSSIREILKLILITILRFFKIYMINLNSIYIYMRFQQLCLKSYLLFV